MSDRVARLLYTEFTDFVSNTPNNAIPNGPVCGSGDIGVSMDLIPGGVRLWLGKNDMWCYRPHQWGGGMKSPAFLTLKLEGADMDGGTLWQDGRDGRIGLSLKDGAALSVCAPRGKGLVILRLKAGAEGLRYEADADTLGEDRLASVRRETLKNVRAVEKRYSGDDVERESGVATALAALNGRLGGGLGAGEDMILAACLVSTEESDDPWQTAIQRAVCLTPAVVKAAKAENAAWWRDFWAASDVCLPGEEAIERAWYQSHYIMACCSDPDKFAPGIFGNFLSSDTPNWGGDYHFNYNHEAPFWGLYSSNHVSLADAYDRPILEYVPQAQRNARERLSCRGLYAKVGIGPHGYEVSKMFLSDGTPSEDAPYWGQKSNAAYAGINFIMRYYATMDKGYLQEKAYPYLKEVIAFWEDYLRFEDGRYMDYDDCIHENAAAGKGVFSWSEGVPDYRDDTNPVVSLGLIRVTLRALLDMSETLDVDEDRREKWRHMLDHMPDYPTQTREGRTVCRYTEKGMSWCDSNSLGIQHIFPVGDIGLDSDPSLLAIARDTHFVLNRWEDYNAFPTFFTAAARLGMDPDIILREMNRQILTHGYPNGFIYYGGGGIECCSAVPSCIDDMLVQNYQGRMRLFPAWDMTKDASFRDLRVWGAFLVSASLRGGKVCDATIKSEAGGKVRLVPPYLAVRVTCGGRDVPTRMDASGDCVFDTLAGETYSISEQESAR